MSETVTHFNIEPSQAGKLRRWIVRHQLISAYILLFGLAWGVLIPVYLGSVGLLPFEVPQILGILVGWAPAAAAVIVSAVCGGRRAVGELLGRFKIWRIGLVWYLAGLFLMAVIILGGIGLHMVFGGTLPPIPALETSLPNALLTFLILMVVGVLVNTEEVLWRGFALPRLQSRYPYLAALVLLAIPEALLHLPNFFDPNAEFYQTVGIAWFTAFTIAAVILYAWIFNSTKGSLIIVTLLHASQNAWSSLLSDNSARPFHFTVALLWAIAIVLILARQFSRRPAAAAAAFD